MGGTHIRLEGRLQHACAQALEVQLLKEGVLLHLTGTTPTTPQAFSRVLAEKLWQGRDDQGGLGRGTPTLAGPPAGCCTWEQSERACGEKRSQYSSATSFTSRSTSSLLIFFFRCWKGDWPAIISYRRQPSAHQSGLNVYRSFFTTSGAGQMVKAAGVKGVTGAPGMPSAHQGRGSAHTFLSRAGTVSDLVGTVLHRRPHAPSKREMAGPCRRGAKSSHFSREVRNPYFSCEVVWLIPCWQPIPIVLKTVGLKHKHRPNEACVATSFQPVDLVSERGKEESLLLDACTASQGTARRRCVATASFYLRGNPGSRHDDCFTVRASGPERSGSGPRTHNKQGTGGTAGALSTVSCGP